MSSIIYFVMIIFFAYIAITSIIKLAKNRIINKSVTVILSIILAVCILFNLIPITCILAMALLSTEKVLELIKKKPYGKYDNVYAIFILIYAFFCAVSLIACLLTSIFQHKVYSEWILLWCFMQAVHSLFIKNLGKKD